MTLARNSFAARLANFPDHALDDDAVFGRRGGWRDFFRRRIGPAFDGRIVLEVGSFDAAFLCAVAQRHSRTAFIGLDWKFKATFLGAQRVAAMGLKNVTLLRGRAQDLRRIFADAELAEIWVFHPEPCDEPRQAQNRLIAEPFLMDVHAVLRDEGSTLSLKTDHPGYYQWVLELLGLPEPAHFAAAREGVAAMAGAAAQPRVRRRELLWPGDRPARSSAILDRFAVATTSVDLWRDEAALARVANHAFADQPTVYESRFIAKRWPIYYVELQKRRLP